MAEVRRGNPKALQRVQKRVQQIIAFRGYGIPLQDRQEIQQDALVQIWQGVNKKGFDAERGFWGFVQVVTARRCIDWMRRNEAPTPTDQPELVSPAPGPLGRALDRERRQLMNAALASLGSDAQELIELRIGAGKSYAEIARRTGRTEQALRAQMYRSVAKARSYIEDFEGDE